MTKVDATPRKTVPELTGFQRDLLYEIAAAEPAKGVTIKDKMENYYGFEVNHGRLYPNLDIRLEKRARKWIFCSIRAISRLANQS